MDKEAIVEAERQEAHWYYNISQYVVSLVM